MTHGFNRFIAVLTAGIFFVGAFVFYVQDRPIVGTVFGVLGMIFLGLSFFASKAKLEAALLSFGGGFGGPVTPPLPPSDEQPKAAEEFSQRKWGNDS